MAMEIEGELNNLLALPECLTSVTLVHGALVFHSI
jgi:hypothetical protein